MAQKIKELYEDRTALKEMSEKAKLTAEEFSIEKTAERLLSIYRTARRAKKESTIGKVVEKVYAIVENFSLAAKVRKREAERSASPLRFLRSLRSFRRGPRRTP